MYKPIAIGVCLLTKECVYIVIWKLKRFFYDTYWVIVLNSQHTSLIATQINN